MTCATRSADPVGLPQPSINDTASRPGISGTLPARFGTITPNRTGRSPATIDPVVPLTSSTQAHNKRIQDSPSIRPVEVSANASALDEVEEMEEGEEDAEEEEVFVPWRASEVILPGRRASIAADDDLYSDDGAFAIGTLSVSRGRVRLTSR